jgi:hypothetical protein
VRSFFLLRAEVTGSSEMWYFLLSHSYILTRSSTSNYTNFIRHRIYWSDFFHLRIESRTESGTSTESYHEIFLFLVKVHRILNKHIQFHHVHHAPSIPPLVPEEWTICRVFATLDISISLGRYNKNRREKQQSNVTTSFHRLIRHTGTTVSFVGSSTLFNVWDWDSSEVRNLHIHDLRKSEISTFTNWVYRSPDLFSTVKNL